MSDEPSDVEIDRPSPEGAGGGHVHAWWQHQFPDEMLQRLVDSANSGDATMTVTLNVGGQTICGALCSGQDFFEDAARELRTAPVTDRDGNELSEPTPRLRDAFESLAVEMDVRAAEYGSNDEEYLTANIHLRDAEVWDASGRHLPLGYWRGRLVDVSGWALGRFLAQ